MNALCQFFGKVAVFGLLVIGTIQNFGLEIDTSHHGDLSKNQPSIEMISWDQLHSQLQPENKKKSELLVINVLPKDVCSDCYIPGSVNIPLHRLERVAKNWPRERNIVVHCAGQQCPLGRYAYEILHTLKFENIRLFDGGMRVWIYQNLPTRGKCKAGYLKG